MTKRHILYIFLFSFLLCLGFFASSRLAMAHEGFVNGVEDLPLMEGFVQIDNSGVNFDSPEGRFFEAYAEGAKVSYLKVIDFYKQSLPQLGWQAKGKNNNERLSFFREGEKLKIEILSHENPCVIRFSILTTQNL